MLVEFGLQIYPNETLASQSKGAMTRSPVTWYMLKYPGEIPLGAANYTSIANAGEYKADVEKLPGWQRCDKVYYVGDGSGLCARGLLNVGLTVLIISLAVLLVWLFCGCSSTHTSFKYGIHNERTVTYDEYSFCGITYHEKLTKN